MPDDVECKYVVPRFDGHRLAHFRKQKKLTQVQLAAALEKYSTRTSDDISRWERGLHTPDLSMIEKLAEVLGVPPINFYGRKAALSFRDGLLEDEPILMAEKRVHDEAQGEIAGRDLDQLLEMYVKMPARYSGREFRSVIDSPDWRATPATEARELNLREGETVKGHVKVRSHWMDAWASGDVAETLCHCSDGDAVAVLGSLAYGTIGDEDPWSPTPAGFEPKVKDLKGFIVYRADLHGSLEEAGG